MKLIAFSGLDTLLNKTLDKLGILKYFNSKKLLS